MVKVVKIQITSISGFVPAEEGYSDVLTITEHSIEYRSEPYEPSDLNPLQIWSYTTNSLAFKNLYNLVVPSIHEIFKRDPQCPGTDMPVTRFCVTYQNKKSIEKVYMVNRNEFSSCFSTIRRMIPACELIPWALQAP